MALVTISTCPDLIVGSQSIDKVWGVGEKIMMISSIALTYSKASIVLVH